MRRKVFMLLAAFLAIAGNAWGNDEGYTWNAETQTLTVTDLESLPSPVPHKKEVKVFIVKENAGKEIPDRIFAVNSIYDTQLEKVVIEDGVETIGTSAFSFCQYLKEVTLPSTLKTIEKSVFYTTKISEIKLPDGLTTIGNSAFLSCSELTEVEIPNTVTSIGTKAFDGCSSMEKVKLPDDITIIDEETFSYCSSLTEIEIPEGVTKIADKAFHSCYSLKKVTIPEGVTSIGWNTFYSCSLEEITFPSTLTTIDRRAFIGCEFKELVIPSSVTFMGITAFQGCNNLEKVTIEEGSLSMVNAYAFQNCENLKEVILPSNITAIGSLAFAGCDNLTRIYYAGTTEPVTDTNYYPTFPNNEGLEVYVGKDYTGDYEFGSLPINKPHQVTLNQTEGGTISAKAIVDETETTIGEDEANDYFRKEITTITLSYEMEEGYTFQGWDFGEANITLDENNSFVMPHEPVTITAQFAKEYSISIEEPYDERISSSQSMAFAGTTITLTPNEGEKEIAGFEITYEEDGETKVESYTGNTFDMPKADVVITNVTFVEPEQPSDDDEDQGDTGIHKPQRPIKYYNIYVDTICPGLNVEVSKDVVQEGHQVSAYLTIQAECDTTGMRFEYKRGLFGYWQDLKALEGVQPGEYIIKNIYTDIYIRALDATLPEEEPTGIDDLEGVKAYAKEGSIYVYTPNREEVTIISMSGAIIKHAEQVGLQSYSVSRGIYIVRIGEKVFKLKN